jgi:hypothetical protein
MQLRCDNYFLKKSNQKLVYLIISSCEATVFGEHAQKFILETKRKLEIFVDEDASITSSSFLSKPSQIIVLMQEQRILY